MCRQVCSADEANAEATLNACYSARPIRAFRRNATIGGIANRGGRGRIPLECHRRWSTEQAFRSGQGHHGIPAYTHPIPPGLSNMPAVSPVRHLFSTSCPSGIVQHARCDTGPTSPLHNQSLRDCPIRCNSDNFARIIITCRLEALGGDFGRWFAGGYARRTRHAASLR